MEQHIICVEKYQWSSKQITTVNSIINSVINV